MNRELFKQGYTQNRELSWLHFDDRCLNEAKDKNVPLLERLKFVSIYTSNLHEFFMVRMGSLFDMMNANYTHIDHKSGKTAKEQLDVIYPACKRGMKKRDEILDDLNKKLAKEGIEDVAIKDCSKGELKMLKKKFKREMAPVMAPQIVDTHHPFPNLLSGQTYIAARVRDKNKSAYAFLPVPASLDGIVVLQNDDKLRFVHVEDVVVHFFSDLYPDVKIDEILKLRVSRSAYVDPQDEAFDDIPDYRKKMLKVLKERKKMNVTTVVLSQKPSDHFSKYLSGHLKVTKQAMFVTHSPMNMKYAFGLGGLVSDEKKSMLLYEPYEPRLSTAFDYGKSLFEQVRQKDVLLSYPYESMEPFLLLLREAANDPDVVSIKITIYRLAERARLVNYLCAAAENGKEVDVLIELKARFDEQNNIDYSEMLEDSGCNVIYGFEKYKVHSKVCLITKVSQGNVSQVALVATGNFNESTAKQYTDLAYLTANPDILEDATEFFRNMQVGKLDGTYGTLLVAPVSLKNAILGMMDEEIAKGENGMIFAKINALTDEEIIAKLKDASCAGVKVTLLVRGISCLLPGVAGKTENIHVYQIVGRYLEHSRIYMFGKGSDEKIYISSADFMTRNTEKRVEVACPVIDPDARAKIKEYVKIYLKDNSKMRELGPSGRYHKVRKQDNPFSAQDEFMRITQGSTQEISSPRHKATSAFKSEI